MSNQKTIQLKDLCTKVKRGSSSFYLREGDEKIKIIRHSAVKEDGRIDFSAVEEGMIKSSLRTSENLLKAGDVLVSIRGPAKVAVVPAEAEGFTYSSEFAALEIDANRIAPELVATYLTLPHVSKYLESKNQGKVIRTISLESVLSLEISVPDSETQQKLSGLLSLISEEYEVIAKEEKRLADLKCAAYSMYLEGA